MAIKTLRVFAEYTSTGFVPMPTAGGIDYGYTLANTFPSTTPSSFQTDDPDLDVTVTAMTDFYVWIRISGTAWNPSYTRNVRVYPDSPDINSVVMNMIIATGPAGTSAYSQIVQTSNRLYFNGATADSTYNSKFAGKTYINELNFGTAPGLATVATSGAYADLTGKPALSTVATSGSYADLSNKPSGTAPISYNSGTNSFQITQASTSTNGFLSSTDWNTFNAKYLLPSGGTTAQYLRGDGTLATFPTTIDSTRLIMSGRNSTGTTLTKGTVVYINGVSGNTPLFARALATGDSTSAQTVGVVEFDIANNSTGVVVLVGAVNNLDTSSFTEGVQLYLSGTTAGAFTSSKILAPTHLVYVGIVTRAHPTQGTIEVKVQNGYELDEIHDVAAQTPTNNDGLFYESSSNLWKNKSIATVLGYTPYNATNPNNYIALTALSASAPLSYNNTTGAFTISQANTTTNGFLSSTDWNTFNSKQSALTLGNVSEVVSNVLMFPDGGTNKTIGNLTIQVVQSSASTNGFLSSTDWTTFNNKQATITGGASTITTSNLTASRALTSNASGKVDVSTVTSTELGYLSGVTSAIQTQLNTKASSFSGTTNYIAKFTSSSAIGNSLIFDNGTSVGIGTATPSTFLHIIGANTTNRGQLSIQSNNTSNAARISFYYDTTLQGNIGTTGGDFYTESINNLITITGGSEKMRVLANGNVGIGTTSPTYKLDVAGTQRIGGVGLPFLDFKTTDTTGTGWQYKQISFSDSTNNELYNIGYFFPNLQFIVGGTRVMTLTNSGRVGIGTTAPTATLSLPISTTNSQFSTGSLEMQSFALNNSWIGDNMFYNGSGFVARNSGWTHQIYFESSNGLKFLTGSSAVSAGSAANAIERMRITTGGDVCVATSTAAYSASGRGNITIGGSSSSMLAFQTGSTDRGYLFHNGSSLSIVNNATGGIFISTTGGGQLIITNSSNILMGTTTDNGERLYVSGSIRATGNITANSDLVLKKNLTLIDNPIDKLNQLNGYLYQWKENDEYQYGVIAQEVEKILPHAVLTGNNGIKGVAYNQLIPVLIEVAKEQNKKIIALEAKLG